MKINWSYLKKPSVIIGAVVLFFIVLFFMNRSSSTSTTATTATSSVDPNVLAANTQIAMAQLGAQVQTASFNEDYAKSQDTNATNVALAQIAAAVSNYNTDAQAAIAAQTIAAQTHGLDLQYQTAIVNNQAQIDALQVQANYGVATSAINAELQAQLSSDQLAAFRAQAMTMAIGSANPGDRDQLTAQYIAATTGTGVNYEPGAHGSAYVAPSTAPSNSTSFSLNIPALPNYSVIG